MAKTYLSTVKYEILAKYEVTGMVEKPDIVGAIFGQSEGLLGEDMDLKELQQNGKIGRIEITVNKGKGTTSGEIIVPSSLDQVKTSILAATIETVEKVGPCEAKVQILKISDTRKEKREQITGRATELLKKMQKFEGVESSTLAESIKSGIRTEKAVTYQGMAAGPDVETSKSIIVVEGRADVLKLLSYGIKSAIEMNGSNISKELIDLCKQKEVTLLIDGDRGGELNAKKLSSLTKVDFVAKAPDGKEVEELTQKEILQGLKRRLPLKEAFNQRNFRQDSNQPRYERNNQQPYERTNQTYERNNNQQPYDRNNNYQHPQERNNYQRPFNNFERRSDNRFNQRGSYDNRPRQYVQNQRPFENRTRFTPYQNPSPRLEEAQKVETIQKVEEAPKEILAMKKDLEKIKGKLKARLFDEKKKKMKDVNVKELVETIGKTKKKIDTILFDGIITKRLVEAAEAKGVKNIVGVRKSTVSSNKIKMYTL
jgi:DNA primase